MQLAYLHCYGPNSDHPELCITADRPDMFSTPARVESFATTSAGVYRVGPQEALTAWKDNDGAIIVRPLRACKLFLTPDLHDQPGIIARKLRIVRTGPGEYKTFYLQDRHAEGEWQEWNPVKNQV